MNIKSQELKTLRAIMHVLDVKSSGNPFLSRDSLPILNGDKFDDFIKSQLNGSVLGLRKKSCKYLNTHSNLVLQKIDEIIQDEAKFEDNSRFLATNLFDKMKSKTNTAVDALFVLLEDENSNKFVSLLLLEYTENIFHEITEIKPNEYIITLKDNIISFPAANAGLKKGAFFKRYDSTDVYNLVIDRNSTVQYFIDEFLNAEIIMDDEQATGEIYSVFTDLSRSALNVDMQALTIQYLDLIESQDTVNIEELLKENTDEYTYNIVKNEFSKRGIVEDEININKAYVETYLKRVIFTLSNGSTIRVPLSFRKSENFQMEENENGTFNISLNNVKIIEEDLKAR